MFFRCTRCVMPNTRPDTAFVDGVCSACLSYERRPQIDWDARKAELIALLDRHDGEVIVPSSGGKDSTYQVMTLLDMGADVTVVTASTCMLTDIGRKNIDNLARYAPTIEVTPNRAVRAKLNRLGLTMVGDISWPEHAAIFSVPFRMAGRLGIPLIMFGENPQDQYGGPLGSQDAREMTLRWRSEFGGFLGLRPPDFYGIEGITANDMRLYEPPSAVALDDVGVEAHFLGQYVPWSSRGNARRAVAAGLRGENLANANWWIHENLDNAQTGIHDFFCYLKYGYGRLCAQISVDIREGLISRMQALESVAYRDGWFPLYCMGVEIAEVLEHIGMDEQEFLCACNQFLNRDIFEGDVAWGERPRRKDNVKELA